jgi:hypothetical protein
VGDVNGDRIVNILDIFQIAKAFGSSSSVNSENSEKYNPKVDLNHDGEINILEVFIAAQAFGKNCKELVNSPTSGLPTGEVVFISKTFSVLFVLVGLITLVFLLGVVKVFEKR